MTAKTLLTAALCFFTLNLPIASAYAHAEHGQPQHGGVHAEAGEAQFEIVGKEGKLTVYATLHGVPLETAGANGKVTALTGTAKSEFELKPAGENRLQASGTIAAGAKLLINVQWPGKKVLQARAVMN